MMEHEFVKYLVIVIGVGLVLATALFALIRTTEARRSTADARSGRHEPAPEAILGAFGPVEVTS